jgi:Tfp pilus assembly protein PilN
MNNPFRRPDAAGASFLPEDYVARKNETRANILSLLLFGVVMFGVVAAFFVTNRQWLSVRREQAAINVQYAQEAERIEQYKTLQAQKAAMLARAEITTSLNEPVPRSNLLAELVSRMPREITLLDLTLESKRIEAPKADAQNRSGKTDPKAKSGSLTKGSKAQAGKDEAKKENEKIAPARFTFSLKLQGVSRANQEIADYVTALKACPLLQAVELAYIKERTIKDVDLREFEITAQLRPDADARSVEPVATLRQGSKTANQSASAEQPSGEEK